MKAYIWRILSEHVDSLSNYKAGIFRCLYILEFLYIFISKRIVKNCFFKYFELCFTKYNKEGNKAQNSFKHSPVYYHKAYGAT